MQHHQQAWVFIRLTGQFSAVFRKFGLNKPLKTNTLCRCCRRIDYRLDDPFSQVSPPAQVSEWRSVPAFGLIF